MPHGLSLTRSGTRPDSSLLTEIGFLEEMLLVCNDDKSYQTGRGHGSRTSAGEVTS
jgi:hypothetical protein